MIANGKEGVVIMPKKMKKCVKCISGSKRSKDSAIKRGVKKDAVLEDVRTKLGMEECAERMGQRSNYAVLEDVRTKP